MAKFFKPREEESTTQAPTYQGCKFGGCKMPAGIVLEPGVYVCRLHDGVEYQHGDKITLMVNNRRMSYRLAYLLINAPAGADIPDLAIAKVRQLGYEQAKTENIRTARQLGASLMRILDDECTAHVHENPASNGQTSNDTEAANSDWYTTADRAMARFMS